jgi:hypothetical protein
VTPERSRGGGAKELLFARVENKADPSVAQSRRELRMTLLRIFQQPARREYPVTLIFDEVDTQ